MSAVLGSRASALVRTSFQKRTMFETPNKILEKQRQIQGSATPYLRGEADPTYLRKPGDKFVAGAIVGATAFAWVAMLWKHTKMWRGQKA